MAGQKRRLWLGALLAALTAAAACGASPSGQYVGIGAGRTLKVRCLEHLAPYVFTGADGKLAGAYIELLEAIAGYAQLRFFVETGASGGDDEVPDLVVGSMFPVDNRDRLYGALSVRNFDPDDPRMAHSVTRMLDSVVEDQQEALCFAFPFLWESSSLFVPQGSADRLENLRGKRICVVLGSPEESFLRKLGYVDELFPTANVTEGMRTLSLRICDAFVCETFQGTYELSKVNRFRYTIRQRTLPLQSYDRAIVVLRGNMELAVKIGHALREIRQSGRYTQILDRWLNDHEEYYLTPRFLIQVSCAVLLAFLVMAVWNHSLARKIRVTVGERERIFDFLREGILAVDAHGKITMLNRMAKTLLDLSDDAFGKNADELIPDLDIARVIRTGRPVYDAEQNLRGSLLSCSIAPVVVDGRVSGAVVTLRDLSELQAIAEEMTGVKMYVESLRIHNHEFMNTLQAVSGLVQLGQYDRAVEFIAAETGSSQTAQTFMTERIKNAAVCGIVMGKAGLCREQHIKFVLDPESFCADHSAEIADRSLVIIVGNLLQNAIEALLEKGVTADSQITLAMYDESGRIFILVRDNAGTMTDEVAEHLFDKGFSTKENPSGYGLYSVNSIVESLGGDIAVDYASGEYTEFTVTIPIPEKTDQHK